MLRTTFVIVPAGIVMIAVGRLNAGGLILNEYNAVRSSRWLQCDGPNCCCTQPTCSGGSQPGTPCAQDTDCPGVYACTADGGNTFTNQLCDPVNLDGDCTLLDPSWVCRQQSYDVSCTCNPPCKGDSFFGRVQGNGGNWIELVVTRNHLDIRGWQLAWTEEPSDAGTLTLSSHQLWSDLRAGTIITFIESDTAAGGLSTDTSYNPTGGDWWININTLSSGGGPQTDFVTTVTNVTGDGPGNFSVGNSNWQLTILDPAANVVFGPCGEGIPLSGPGVNDREVFKLEEDPAPTIDPISSNYRDGTSSSFGGPNLWSDGNQRQDFTCLRCDDGAFCNGVEGCDANRACRSGPEPCLDRAHCDETADRCLLCIAASECDDADPCTENSCVAGACRFSRIAGCGGGTTPPGPGDADSDGVPDDADACPGTPASEAVDEDGCGCSQLDSDNDGVNDCDDACPGTLADEDADETGCACRQLDDDEDGVDNCEDACSHTLSDAVVDTQGCSCLQRDPSGDHDRDGILNCFDKCPETVFGHEADAQGCSCVQLAPDSDEDRDGVPDCLDECAATPPVQAVDDLGCPIDQSTEPIPGEELPGTDVTGDDGGTTGSPDDGTAGENPSVPSRGRACGALGMINLAFLLCGLLVHRLGRRKPC